MSYRIEVIKHISEVNQKEWDKLSPSCFATYSFLKEVEKIKTLPISPRYVIVYKNDKMVAISTAYIETEAEYSTTEQSVYGNFTKLFKSLFLGLNPCLLVHVPSGTISKSIGIRKEKNIKDERKIYQLLIDEFMKIAKKENIPRVGFAYIREDEELLRNILSENKFVSSFSCFEVFLNVIWKTFNEYLDSFGGKKRKKIKKEINVNKRQGIVTSHLSSLTKDRKAILDLFDENFFKHQRKKGKLTKKFTEKIIKIFDKNIGIIVDKRNGEVASSCLYIKYKDNMSISRIGHDPKLSANNFTLFNVAIYEPLRIAIKEGFKKINLGTGAYKYKLLRKAQVKPMYLYIKSTSKISNFFLGLLLPLLSKIKRKKHEKKCKLN